MNCRVCGTEIIETDGVYLIGGDLCHLHYWQENQDSPYFPLSGYSRADFEIKTHRRGIMYMDAGLQEDEAVKAALEDTKKIWGVQ